MIKIRKHIKYAYYITSLEEENDKLKAENEELRSQVEFIHNLPKDRLDDLISLSKELEQIKDKYLSAIESAHEAKSDYEDALSEVKELKQELIDSSHLELINKVV